MVHSNKLQFPVSPRYRHIEKILTVQVDRNLRRLHLRRSPRFWKQSIFYYLWNVYGMGIDKFD